MKNLSYQARTNYPTSEDVDRIVSQVIGNVSALCSDSVNQQTAEILACEIKRRLCDLISVEVDLVITGSTETEDAPAPATLSDFDRIGLLCASTQAPLPRIVIHEWLDVFNESTTAPSHLQSMIEKFKDGKYESVRSAFIPVLKPCATGIQMRTPGDIVRGSLPGLI